MAQLVDENDAVVGHEDEESEIEVRTSRLEDAIRIAGLLEFHGMSPWLAEEEKFLVAEQRSERTGILAALEYRTAANGLLLGYLVTDPRIKERPLARALYTEAYALATKLDIIDIRARPTLYRDYPYDVGYWRWGRHWRSSTAQPLMFRGELPGSRWRRLVALSRVFAIPFLRVPWKQTREPVATDASSVAEAEH